MPALFSETWATRIAVERLKLAPPAPPAVAEVEAILLRLHGAFQHIEQEGGRRGQLGGADNPSGQYGEELVRTETQKTAISPILWEGFSTGDLRP